MPFFIGAVLAAFMYAFSTYVHASEPPVVIPIKWVRINEFPQSEVRDGACVIYAPMTSHKDEDDDVPLEPLVLSCLAKGGLVLGSGDFDVTWERVDADQMSIMQRRVYDRPGRISTLLLGLTIKTGPHSCTILQRRWRERASFAHELLHCYLGSWHM